MVYFKVCLVVGWFVVYCYVRPRSPQFWQEEWFDPQFLAAAKADTREAWLAITEEHMDMVHARAACAQRTRKKERFPGRTWGPMPIARATLKTLFET